MTKAENDPITGERAGAPETQAAGRRPFQSSPGLTSVAAGGQSCKATDDAITADRAVAPETAAAAVALTAPSIMDLGKHLAQVEISYNAHDIVFVDRTFPASDEDGRRKAKLRSSAAQDLLMKRGDALRNMISTLPAKTLADAAVQLAVIAEYTSRLAANLFPKEESVRLMDDIERMAFGVLPVLANAAGLDMAEMDWADNDQLRIHRYSGVGVTS